MMVPRWLMFLVATWVIGFGLFRIVIALRRPPVDENRPNFRQKGLYARSPRSHALLGAVYVLLGVVLVAMGFGWVPPLGGGTGGTGGGSEADSVGPDSRRAPVDAPILDTAPR